MHEFLRKTFFLTALLMVFSTPLFAADRYVRPNGGVYGLEDGSDWSNAYDGFTDVSWGALSAGDTLWIAGGSYTQDLIPAAAGTSGSRIYAKRATAGAHGTETGWDAGFDAQVILSGGAEISFNTLNAANYLTVDGVTDNGIRVNYLDTGRGVSFNRGSSYVTLQYLLLVGPGKDQNQTGSTRAIDITAWNGSSYDNVSNLTISHVDMSNSDTLIQCAGSDFVTLEYSTIHDAGALNWADWHPNSYYVGAGCDNGVVRFNTFYNLNAEGLFFTEGGQTGWKIYGNLFHDCEGSGRGIEWKTGISFGYFEVYNNTFVDLSCNVGIGGSGTRTGLAYNNLFYNSSAGFGGLTHDYNASSVDLSEANDQLIVSSIFTNYAGGDYTLSGALAGTALSTPYDVDMLGTTRGTDSVFDIGAFEFDSGAPDTTPSAFSFTDQTGVALGSTGNTDNVTVAGIDNTTTLALTGDVSCKYSINGAAWATANDNITVGDNVALQNVTSGSYSTAISCTLNLGGVTDTWTRTTLAAISDPVAPRFRGASMSGGWR